MMRVVGLGIVYGAVFGGGLGALFGMVIALFGPQLGLTLPHDLAGLSGWGIVLNTLRVGLVAGMLGGALLGGLILWQARGRVRRGHWIGVIAALLPLVWLPFFATRGMLRRGTVTDEDVMFFLLLVIAPLTVAASSGWVMGGRLARAAGQGIGSRE
ncbi:MAG: hypothetical protein KIT87_12765 [Anaerolineae bacterium]|nr:hypothetical protein [Anaerolineae bacterium]